MINAYVNSVRRAVNNENWYCALALALALPDICGSIENPTEESSKKRFVAWYNQYIAPKFPEVFTIGVGDLLLRGADCYALRCAFLHNGAEDITSQRAQELLEKFYFVQPLKNWSFNTRAREKTLVIQVDLFCLLVCDAVDAWMNGRALGGREFLTIYDPRSDGIPM